MAQIRDMKQTHQPSTRRKAVHIRLVPIGVVVLASTQPIKPEDEQLISQLLPNFAVALNNALSHERLQRVAAIDTLTGLYNRRFGLSD